MVKEQLDRWVLARKKRSFIQGMYLVWVSIQGHPKREFKQNTWNVIFCFLRLFQNFLKAYLCKLIHFDLDLLGFLSWKFRSRKISGNSIYPPNFRAADGSPEMLADLILCYKRHICPLKTIGANKSSCCESPTWCFAEKISSFHCN